jgi:hypothetical protein
MKKTSYPIKSEHVDTLMKRFIYLNQLRVGVISVFFAIVAALFAMWRGMGQEIPEATIQVALFFLLFIGFLVFVFDLRCRARSSRTAQGIRARIIGLKSYRIRRFVLRDYFRIDEDAIFSMIVMGINGGITAILISTIIPTSFTGIMGTGFLVFVTQFILYSVSWRQIVAKSIDEWPDDDFLDQSK